MMEQVQIELYTSWPTDNFPQGGLLTIVIVQALV